MQGAHIAGYALPLRAGDAVCVVGVMCVCGNRLGVCCAGLVTAGRAIDPLHVRSPLAIDGVHPAEGYQGDRTRTTIPTYGMGAHSVFEKLPERAPHESSSTATNIRLPFSRTRTS